MSVCGYHIRESGATPTQEMAWGFCIARAYAREVVRRGVPIDDFADRLSYNFNIYGNLFEQVAKFRAGRGLWARIVKEEFGATKPSSMWLRMIAGGGGSGLTAEQPELNIVRGAYYALVGALSGAQTMALCCYDEAYTIPSEYAQRISLRTMQLLVEEIGLADTVDPLGGSYYMETLTNQMRAEMERIIAETDAAGGIVDLIEQGAIQARVSAQAYRLRRAIESGEFPKVGVNRYRNEGEAEREVEMHPHDEAGAAAQVAALKRVRAERDAGAVARALERVESDARAGRNLMPAIVDAVKAYASVGEISERMVGVWGRYAEPVRFDDPDLAALAKEAA